MQIHNYLKRLGCSRAADVHMLVHVAVTNSATGCVPEAECALCFLTQMHQDRDAGICAVAYSY
jgi:hypothetical protein